MTNSRRIEALRNLAERGATEGEREAARKALDVHERKQRAACPFPRTEFNDAAQDYASFLSDLYSYRAPYMSRRRGPLYDYRFTQIFVDDVPPTPPRTWPEAVDVEDHPTEPARVRLEVSTRAEMFSRFRNGEPLTIRWRGEVWRTEGYAGTCADRETYPPRLYLTINTARLTKLS